MNGLHEIKRRVQEHCTVAWRHRDGELVVLRVFPPSNNPPIVRGPLSRVGVKRRKERKEGGREGGKEGEDHREGARREDRRGRKGTLEGKRKGRITTSRRGSDPRSRNGDVEVQAQAK